MNNKKIPTSIGTIVLIIIAVTVFGVVWKWEKSQPNSQQPVVTVNVKKPVITREPAVVNQQEQAMQQKENPVLQESVSFCRKTYQASALMVGGVDIVKRIAKIATENPENKICENIEMNSSDNNLDIIVFKQKVTDVDYKDGIYFANISILNFKIDVDNNSIFALGAFAGEPTFIGKLK